MKLISLRRAVKPRNGVTWYAVVQSRTRGTRVNHSVVTVALPKRKNAETLHRFDCSCEDSILNQNKNCEHIQFIRTKINLRLKKQPDNTKPYSTGKAWSR